MTQTILSQTCVILFMMAVGLMAGRLGCLNETAQRALSAFLMSFFASGGHFSVCRRAADAGAAHRHPVDAGAFLRLFAVVFPLAVLLARRVSGAPGRGRLFAASLIFANVGLLGFPVADAPVPGKRPVLCRVL